MNAEYLLERFERTPALVGPENFIDLETHRLALGAGFFHPSGITARVKATLVHQDGVFGNGIDSFSSGEDRFVVFDAAIGYRLPRRTGLITLEGVNLLNEGFRFQDTDPANPDIFPERAIFVKANLFF